MKKVKITIDVPDNVRVLMTKMASSMAVREDVTDEDLDFFVELSARLQLAYHKTKGNE